MSDPDAPHALAIQHDGWGELVLSRPARRNALTGRMAIEARAGLGALIAAGSKAIVLRGEGGFFSSGLDLDAFAATPPPPWRASWPQDWSGFHQDLYRSPAVIVGALERFAINGAASLALACDLLVVGDDAYLLVGEAAIGMNAPMNIAWLRLRTTEAIAAQLALGAERIHAADLQRLGLAYKIVGKDHVVEEARSLAAKLASYRGEALAAIKFGLRRPVTNPEDLFDANAAAGFRTAAAPPRT